MYLWKVDSLVEDFKTDKVTQWEEFKYMLLFSVLTVITYEPLSCNVSAYNYYDYIDSVLAVAITIGGVYYCYKINKEGDNKNFIARVICIGLPVAVRISVLFILVLFLYTGLELAIIDIESVAEDELEVYETTPLMVTTLSIVMILYYLYLSKKIRAVSS